MNMIEHRSKSSRAQAGSLGSALRRPSRAVIIVLSSLVAITAIILWAGFAEIDQLVRARGQVIAVERTQMIEATDNGVLAQMYVREGQMVKKGQLLAQLDQSRVMAA